MATHRWARCALFLVSVAMLRPRQLQNTWSGAVRGHLRDLRCSDGSQRSALLHVPFLDVEPGYFRKRAELTRDVSIIQNCYLAIARRYAAHIVTDRPLNAQPDHERVPAVQLKHRTLEDGKAITVVIAPFPDHPGGDVFIAALCLVGDIDLREGYDYLWGIQAGNSSVKTRSVDTELFPCAWGIDSCTWVGCGNNCGGAWCRHRRSGRDAGWSWRVSRSSSWGARWTRSSARHGCWGVAWSQGRHWYRRRRHGRNACRCGGRQVRGGWRQCRFATCEQHNQEQQCES